MRAALFVLLGIVSWVTPARAQVGITVHEVADAGVRVDGSLRDWRRIRLVQVGRGEDASMGFALGYDARGLYVAASVLDDHMVRTGRPGTMEDAIVLTVATPQSGGRFRATDLWIWAGIPGRSAGSVGLAPAGGRRPTAVSGARVVEGPRQQGDGYLLEAFIPWAAIPGGSAWQRGRAAIRLVDVDREARPEIESQPSSAPIDPAHPERLPELQATGGEGAMLRSFLRGRDLEGTRPRHDLRGDVVGDARPERVVVVEHFVVVMGDGYRRGEAFDFFELPVVSAADVRSAELRDLTGDGKKELLLRLRQRDQRGARDLFQTFSFLGEQIRPLWGVELRKETAMGFVEAEIAIRRARRGAPLIEVSTGRADGLDAVNFHEARATGVEPILLPWGPTAARTYQWTGRGFEVVSERENRDYERPPDPAAQRRTVRQPVEPPPGPSVREIIAEFKRRAGLPRSARPSFQREVNVAGDPRPEQVLVFGRNLVVAGPSFRGGQGWFHFQIPAAADEDVLSVETVNLTQDARQEFLIRIRRRAGEVQREVLLVHQFRPRSFPRLLTLEVAREHGDNRVESAVRVIRRGRTPNLELRPERARGWSADNWPFAEGGGEDGIEPILLPWRDRAVRYHFERGEMVR